MFGRVKQLLVALSAITIVLVPILSINVSASPDVTEYAVDPGNNFGRGLYDITAGPDGALWFTEENTSEIGRITSSGSITEYSTPSPPDSPAGITTGPDGALWFAEYSRNKIGRVTTNGETTEFSIPYDGNPWAIAAGPDGALWFTEMSASGDAIGRMTTAGVVNMYSLSAHNSAPLDITVGPDGALWFIEENDNTVGRISTTGNITYYTIPTPNSNPLGITTGPDGALWFTENTGNKIGRITSSGSITEYTLPDSGTYPTKIAAGSDGALWFTMQGNNNAGSIGRITVSGDVSEYAIPTSSPAPSGITAGPDGALWFTEFGSNKIGRITTPPPAPSAPTNLTAPSPTNQPPSLTWDATSSATSYNIYRNGIKIDSTTNTTYTDSSLTSDGTYSYSVTAVNGNDESDQSSPVSVVYDTTPPTVTITGAVNGETYAANNAPTPVCNTSDSLSGVATNATLTVFNIGTSYTATCSGATDNAGNVAYNTGVTYTVLPANYTLVTLGDSSNNPLSNAKVTLTNSAGTVTTLTTDSFGNAYLNTAPGTYKVTAYYANGYQSQNITTTNTGPNNVTFTTVPVTVTINDPNSADLGNAKVAQAGNTGTFGSKTAVDANGQVTFQVLPGTSYFTAYVANGYQTQSLNVTPNGNNAITFNTDTVQVTVTKNGSPLPTATVKQAGNSGTFGSSQNVDNNGQYTFYVLPGTNYFEAFDGPNNYTKQTVNVTGDTTVTLAVN